MAAPDVIEAQQAPEPKVDPPRAGTNGVTSPQCVYCPAPKKAGKGKISGTVLLDVTRHLKRSSSETYGTQRSGHGP